MKKLFGLTIIALFTTSIINAQITDVTPKSNAVKDSLPTTTSNKAVVQEQPAITKQSSKEKKSKKYSNVDLSHRSADHIMLQLGGLGWSGASGVFSLKGLSREFNISFMLDKPFKGNPHYSLGFGLGYSSSNAFFKGKYVDIKSATNPIPITATIPGTTNTFKKFKVVLNYAEIPLELRYSSIMENPAKGFRMAIGLKGGMLLSAHSKGKNELDNMGNSVYGTPYVEKQYSKRYFKTTRISATARVGYGMLSIYGTYQLSPLLETGAGPVIHPYTIGLALGIM